MSMLTDISLIILATHTVFVFLDFNREFYLSPYIPLVALPIWDSVDTSSRCWGKSSMALFAESLVKAE